MDEYLFVSEDYLVQNSVIDGNVDFKNITSTIIHCQDIHLQKVLGTPLFEDLCAKGLGSPSFNSNEIFLIKKYIQKTLLWYILMELPPEFKFKYMNKGIMVKSSDNSQPADTGDIKWMMNRCKIKAEDYGNLLKDYLICHTTLFPKYLECTTFGLNSANTVFSTGLALDEDYYEQEKPKIIIVSSS